MKKNTLKYVLDILLFIQVCSVASVGILLGFIIPKGGPGPGEKYFLGLHRSGWVNIHLYLSLIFLALLAGHLFLNWPWIVQSTKRVFGDKWRNAMLVISGGWMVLLVFVWIIASL